MRTRCETILPCEADEAWAEVQTFRLLAEVAAPIIRLRPVAGEGPLPERWTTGSPVRVRPHLFGFIPLPIRTLAFERIDPARREIQTREYDKLVSRWDHLIRVERLAGGQCRYIDEVEVRAGVLTPLVWLFAIVFYRHRQRRWQTVARRVHRRAEPLSTIIGLA